MPSAVEFGLLVLTAVSTAFAQSAGRAALSLASKIMRPSMQISVLLVAVFVLSAAFAAGLATTVLAQSDEGNSEEESARQQSCSDPAKPTGLSATGGDRTISVSWNAVADPPTGFYLHYEVNAISKTGSGGGTKITASTSVTYTGLTNGAPYAISVKAVVSDDIDQTCNGPSASAGATPSAPVPPTPVPTAPAPSGLGVNQEGTQAFTFTWDLVPGATRYRYEFSVGGVTWEGRMETPGRVANIRFGKGIYPCTDYHFQVQARGDGSPYSTTWGSWANTSIKSDPPPGVPSCTPTGPVAPTFREGSSTTRSVAENTAADINIGTPVSATDRNNDTLTYSFSGTGDDAGSFRIVSSSGHIRTSARLDYETESTYSVTVEVTDSEDSQGNPQQNPTIDNRITVTINVTDVNERPEVDREIEDQSLTVGGSSASIGLADKFSDPDGDTLRLVAGTSNVGVARVSVSEDDILTISPGRAGTARVTVTAYDRYTNTQRLSVSHSFNVTVTIPDPSISISGLASSLEVGTSDSFTVSASNLDSSNSYTIEVTTSNTNAGFNSTCSDTEETVDVPASSTSHSATITLYACGGRGAIVTAKLKRGTVEEDTDLWILFVTPSISISGLENNLQEGSSDSFTVSASNLDSSNSYTIEVTTSNTNAGFNSTCSDTEETVDVPASSTSHSATITLYACGGRGAIVTAKLKRGSVEEDTATQTVTVTMRPDPLNYPPVFDEGSSATRSVPEKSAAGTDIGSELSASDHNGDTLTYSLSGTDAGSFDIVSSSGQIQTKAALDYESDSAYSVTVEVTDGANDASISVIIHVLNVDEAGSAALPTTAPQVGTEFTATLNDPDRVTSTPAWVWQLSTNGVNWTDIFGVTGSTYTPRSGDIGKRLRTTATYDDGHGKDKTATSSASMVVVAAPPPITRPPGKIRNLKIKPGDTELQLTWDPPLDNGGISIRRYYIEHVIYDATDPPYDWTGASRSRTSTASTGHTIMNLINGTEYKVRVRAQNLDNKSRHWHPDATELVVTGIPEPLPTITITPDSGSVKEGSPVRFTLTADPAPKNAITVKIVVIETGSYIYGTVPNDITFPQSPPGSTTATAALVVLTMIDGVDEVHGTIKATVESGDGYEVGSPFVARTRVTDEDRPPAPTGLRANGNLVGNDGDEVTLRWNKVPDATYNVRFIREVCSSSGVCGPDPGDSWETESSIATRERPILGNTGVTVVKEARLDELSPAVLYRVEVQAVIVDSSAWSNFAFVYPTDSQLEGEGHRVGTAPFHGYQGMNGLGSHEFRYVLCEETIPTYVNLTSMNMKSAVDKWEDTVIWKNGQVNIIATTDYPLDTDEVCTDHYIPPGGRFEIKFVSNMFMKYGKCGWPLPFVDAERACWRSKSWSTTGIQEVRGGSVLLNASMGPSFWNDPLTDSGRCTALQLYLVHEVGHAFGIGTFPNQHPYNKRDSIMSYATTGLYCEPQEYDIVALMALYQSR